MPQNKTCLDISYKLWQPQIPNLAGLYPLHCFFLVLVSCFSIYLATKRGDGILLRNIDWTWCYKMLKFLDISGLNLKWFGLLLFVGCFWNRLCDFITKSWWELELSDHTAALNPTICQNLLPFSSIHIHTNTDISCWVDLIFNI